ncbi:Histidine--tRNA ligase [uncultured archaeon]|nr:Histidine--tRNA ligase [uncultured archaeon]
MEIAQIEDKQKSPVFLAYTPDVKVEAVKIAKALRQKMPVVLDVMGRALGPQLKAAASAGAQFAIIVGRTELDSGKLILRDMQKGSQESLTLADIEETLKEQLSRL